MGVSTATASAELGRAERNKLERRQRMVDAARRLFREQGFDATTMSDIARAADVGKGTLFLHAASKDGLLVMVFEQDIGELIQAALHDLVPGAGGALLDDLLLLFGRLHDGIDADRSLCALFVKEMAFVRGDKSGIEATMQPLRDGLAVLVRAAVRRGELAADTDATLLAHNLFALFFFHLLTWLGGGDDRPAHHSPDLAQMLDLQLAAARTRR